MEPYFIYKDEIAAFIGRMYTLNCTLVVGRRIQELHLLAFFILHWTLNTHFQDGYVSVQE